MTAFDRIEPRIAELMDELAPAKVPDYFDHLLQQTARTRQRPAWSAIERWLPMDAFARTAPVRQVPWRLIAIAALLVVATATAVALMAGSERRAGGDGLILFGISVSVPGDPGTYCTTFHTIRPDGSGQRQLIGDCVAYGSASWSPTGDGIIIDGRPLSSSTTRISEITADGGAQHALLTLAGGGEPAFSPDGSQIAYAADSGGIIIAAADGTGPRQLTSTLDATKSFDMEPRFSPDGSRLVFTRYTNDSSTMVVWMVNADGTNLHRLTTGLSQSSFARWSPDGSHLVFTGSPPVTGSASSDVGLWTIDADGTGLTRVIPYTGDRGRDEEAAWSPDGSRIVYKRFDPGTGRDSLRVVNADGSGMTTLLSNSEGQAYKYKWPDWGLPNRLQPEIP